MDNNNHPKASRSVSIVGGGSMSSNQQNEVQELPQHQNENIAEGSPMLNNNSPTAIPVDDGDNVSSRVGGAATEKLGVSAAASNDDNAVASPSDPNVNNVTYDGGNTEVPSTFFRSREKMSGYDIKDTVLVSFSLLMQAEYVRLMFYLH